MTSLKTTASLCSVFLAAKTRVGAMARSPAEFRVCGCQRWARGPAPTHRSSPGRVRFHGARGGPGATGGGGTDDAARADRLIPGEERGQRHRERPHPIPA